MFTVSIDITEGILHTCGGDPFLISSNFALFEYSPHMLRVLLSLSAQINSL